MEVDDDDASHDDPDDPQKRRRAPLEDPDAAPKRKSSSSSSSTSSYFPGRATPAGSVALARQRQVIEQLEAETKKNRELFNSTHSHSSFGSKVRTLNQSRFAPLRFLPHLYSLGARAWLICPPTH
jgi:hypothetical protein